MHCDYTQSAISQIISALEKELNVPLLHRTPTGIELTPEGVQMLPYFESLRDAGEALYAQSENIRRVESGHIRIGTFSSVSSLILAPILKEFKQLYPKFTIEIREGDNMAIESWLTQGKVDFGFIDAPSLPGYVSIPVCKDPFVAVVSPDSEYASYETIPLSLFEKAPVVLFDEGTRKEAMGLLFKNKIKPNVEYTSRNDNFILSLIEDSDNLGYMGKLILERMPHNVISKPTTPQLYRSIVFTYQGDDHLSAAGHRFLSFAKKQLKQKRTADS